MVEKTGSIDIAAGLVLILGVAFALGPFWLMLTTASVSFEQTLRGIPLLPGDRFLENLRWVVSETLIPRQMLNSLVIAAMVTMGKAVVAFLSAFGLVYFNVRLKSVIFPLIIVTLMLPLEVRIVPTFSVAANVLSPVQSLLDQTGASRLIEAWAGRPVVLDLGLLNTHLGMALPLIATATGTFMFRQFFRTLPPSLVEAARMDGAGPWAFIRHILLPLSTGPLGALAVMMFLGAWNQYLWPLMITTDPSMRPAIIGLAQLQSGNGSMATEYNHVMAAALLVVLPSFLVIALFQRSIVNGLTLSEK